MVGKVSVSDRRIAQISRDKQIQWTDRPVLPVQEDKYMSHITPDVPNAAILREALDWTVFTLGLLSLTTAVVATILTHA
jgi:hypothetical protein